MFAVFVISTKRDLEDVCTLTVGFADYRVYPAGAAPRMARKQLIRIDVQCARLVADLSGSG